MTTFSRLLRAQSWDSAERVPWPWRISPLVVAVIIAALMFGFGRLVLELRSAMAAAPGGVGGAFVLAQNPFAMFVLWCVYAIGVVGIFSRANSIRREDFVANLGTSVIVTLIVSGIMEMQVASLRQAAIPFPPLVAVALVGPVVLVLVALMNCHSRQHALRKSIGHAERVNPRRL